MKCKYSLEDVNGVLVKNQYIWPMKYVKSSILILLVLLLGCSSNKPLTPGEGYAEVSGGKIWYYVLGEGDEIPMLMLHGGPGGSSNSMFVLGELSESRPLIILDQPGTGKSGNMTDTSLMTMDYFLGQLHEFTEALGLKKYYLYGHSWGTALGLDYYLAHPKGIKALILNSPLISTEMWIQDADTLISMLPDSIQQMIRINEASKNYDSRDYQYAEYIYYKNYIVRGKRRPNPYDIPPSQGNSLMYEYMWGPSEFTATGSLKNYDRTDRLDEISIPALFITGEYDEARPTTVKYFSTLTPQGEFAVIEDAAHGCMHDNQEQNVALINEFLESIER